jgi:hypothetical protein
MPDDPRDAVAQALMMQQPGGLLEPGNIDLHARPVVHNPDGSISTVRSVGWNVGGQEVLMPTVYGQSILSDRDALKLYQLSGKHLGKFDTPEHADAYAKALHEQQADEYRNR